MFKGSIVALVTPFTENDEIDVEALEALVDFHVEARTDGLICLGTTGEASTLTNEERRLVIETVLKRGKGKIPVIAGTGCNATKLSYERTIEAKALGVDGALIIVPYYNKPTEEGCVRHFEEVAKANLPLIAYHHPGRTGVHLSLETLGLIAKIPHVVAIKEASGDVDLAINLCGMTSKPILSGDDTLTLSLLLGGGSGVCSIVANVIPSLWKELVDAFARGDIEKAKHISDKYTPLCNALVIETNPQCVKYALSLMGKCSSKMRLPLLEPRDATKKLIKEALEFYGVDGGL